MLNTKPSQAPAPGPYSAAPTTMGISVREMEKGPNRIKAPSSCSTKLSIRCTKNIHITTTRIFPRPGGTRDNEFYSFEFLNTNDELIQEAFP